MSYRSTRLTRNVIVATGIGTPLKSQSMCAQRYPCYGYTWYEKYSMQKTAFAPQLRHNVAMPKKRSNRRLLSKRRQYAAKIRQTYE